MLNEELIKRQNLSEDRVVAIKELHSVLAQVLARPTMFCEEKEIACVIQGIEYALQGLWGFPFDSTKHRYWNQAIGCLCPHLDNQELYGTAHRWINSMCPFHGVPDIGDNSDCTTSKEQKVIDDNIDSWKKTGRW